MAYSLGYALMSWSSEFARHSKAKKCRKREAKLQRKLARGNSNPSSAISEFEIEYSPSSKVGGMQTHIDGEVQTEVMQCERCLELGDEVCHLESQLCDVDNLQNDMRRKLSTTKTTLATAMERESKLRDANESLQLDEAQLRYELDQLKVNLLHQLDEQERVHSEQVKAIEQAMSVRECEWANRNELLQQELRATLHSALKENEQEDLSLNSLEKEISSLQAVIEMRGSENRQLREENNKLKNKLENHNWLETELGKAKHRLEELALIVQNKMVSERELLDLSEALQRDLVRSRGEALHLKQQLETKNYVEKNLLKVRHSQSDLFNNALNNNLTATDNYANERKLSSLQQIKNWTDLEDGKKGAKISMDKQQPVEHRNQHQKLW